MFFYSISPLHTRSTLFPYTTLFRSPFAYQWSLDGTPAGTNATLTVPTGGLTLGNHTVQVVAGGECAGSPGTVTNTATLTVTALTSASGPTNTAVCLATDANFSTTVSGTGPFDYEWTLDDSVAGTN